MVIVRYFDRVGISYPMTMLLITVIAIAATVIAGYFFYHVAQVTAKQPLAMVLGTPVVINGVLYVTLKNVGTANLEVYGFVGVGGVSGTINEIIKPGEVKTLEISLSGEITGSIVKGVLKTNAGEIAITAQVIS
ncbi:MAG: hypothetical protein DRJ40_02145 [Thermoprotei archaeon]|nr:MAG: hypothetical protein DRJ40_02145 [Thermoprotei archaeon]